VSQGMVMERALGMTTGHAETFEYCERWIHRLEGAPGAADQAVSAGGHQLRIEQSAPFGP
jgi:TetR/AcrR family transcriptional regulator